MGICNSNDATNVTDVKLSLYGARYINGQFTFDNLPELSTVNKPGRILIELCSFDRKTKKYINIFIDNEPGVPADKLWNLISSQDWIDEKSGLVLRPKTEGYFQQKKDVIKIHTNENFVLKADTTYYLICRFKTRMLASIKAFSDLYSICSHHVDRLCEPNHKYSANRAEQDVTKTRNKVVFLVHFICIFLYFSDHFISAAPLLDCIWRMILCASTIAFLFLSCRFHPEIFRILYTIACMSYGPGVMDSSQPGVLAAWLMSPVLPTFHLLFTGNFRHFVLQCIIQIIYIHNLYYHRMENLVMTMTPEAFTHAMKNAFFLVFAVQLLVVLLSHYMIMQAHNRAWANEQKKIEIENQKIFLLSFSHELRNLINSLAGNVKLTSLEKNLSQRAKELLLNAEVCGELLLHLVNNILDTGKVEIGELEINPNQTKIYETFERIWGVCSELIRRRDLQGHMRIQNDLPRTILADHYRLTQIFLNLVGNAVKFTDKGSINVSIEWNTQFENVTEACFEPYPYNEQDDHDEGLFEKHQLFNVFDREGIRLDTSKRQIDASKIKQAVKVRKGVLKVTICDTGCGMDSSQKSQLFQKFTQVTSDASKRKLGTGLGLFISKQLCQRMGGEIRVFSKKDKGSCFAFCLPMDVVDNGDEQFTNLDSLKRTVRQKKLTAMIVDDAPFNHLILTNFFEELGIRVIDTAVNGLEAFEKYNERIRTGERPHIIAMDLDMPIMNGKDSSRKIRDLEKRIELTPSFLSIISGNCSESEIAECMNKHGAIQADAFLKKPASLDELLRVIGYHFVRE